MYDFDESGVLTIDEMVLALRSSLSGLSKLSRIDPPTEAEIEAIVVLAFDAIRRDNEKTPDFIGIDKEAFVRFCLNSPEVVSWIEYFDDLEEYNEGQRINNAKAEPTPTRNEKDEAAMNPTLGGLTKLEFERKGPASTRENWENVLPFLKPARDPEENNDLPQVNVSLEWVYGFNAHSSRQALYYSAKGSIIYGAGAICVVQDVQKKQQQYFLEHTDLISCIKVYYTPEGETIVASGEVGRRPAVHVWNCDNGLLLSTLVGFHRNGIAQLDFSPDRKKLVTLGMDLYNCIAIYDWASRMRLWSSRTTDLKVHDVRFLSNDIVASCGENHIYFWSGQPTGVYKRYRGHFGTAVQAESLWCVGAVGNTVFTGSETGMIHVWEGRTVVRSIKGHTGIIYACCVIDSGDESGLITACSAGKIQVWNSKLEIGATFNAIALGAIDNCVYSLSCDILTSKVLVGFKTCEIFEIDYTDGRNVHNSAVVGAHYHPRICGLSTHPIQGRYFCTVGDDRTVRVFDAQEHKQLRVSMLDTIGHCCSYSNDGQVILIGMGTGIDGEEERKEGAFIALSGEDLTLLYEARDSRLAIADIKFSPNGEKIAMASHDGSVYVYDFKKYRSKAKCRGHSGKVMHVDFSSNSQFLMSNCSNGELLFWDSDGGELQPPKNVKITQWDTNSCVYSYGTQGVWSKLEGAAYINSACKSNAQDFLFIGDTYGMIRVYQFPCISNKANPLICYGHAKEVMNCKISCDDERLFTSGGKDGTVMQWKVNRLEKFGNNNLKKDESLPTVMPAELAYEGKLIDRPENFEHIANYRPIAISKMEEGEDDVGQILPWQRSVVAPSRVPQEDTSEPSDGLELEFVYGINTTTTRQSLLYTPKGDLLFFIASVAVIMDQKQRKQIFYTQHRSTITAMALNKQDGLVATGDLGEAPYIRIWSIETMNTEAVLHGFHRRAIAHLKFSNDFTRLLTVGQDNYHSIAVYDWRNKVVLCSTQSFENKSLFADFSPNGESIIHCGNEVIRFWDVHGRNMTFQDAAFGNRAKLQGYLCGGWIGSNAVVGTADGNLYRFLGNKLDSIVMAHSGAVNVMAYCSDGICTGSTDGFIKIWTRFLECRLVVDTKNLRTVSNNVRNLDWDFELGRIVFATASAEVVEIGSGDGENIHAGPLLEGHGGDELWGLAVNPVKEEFCTVGDDSFLRVWNAFSHATVANIALEMPGRCCAYSPNGKNIAIGLGCPKKVTQRQFDGKWIVVDTDDYQIIHEARDSTKWLTDVKYSPNGELIAFGGYDNKIYVYSVNDGYALNAAIGQHQSFITSVDFSEDSAWLQSNCGGLELNFFEADTGLFIPAPSRLRDTQWATQTCTMGWAVQGIWPPQKDGTDCTACDCNLFRGEDGVVAAVGDNYGRIRLFRYPCTSSFASSKNYWASTTPITRIKFIAGDSYLVSLAGQDKAIMQWAHKRDRDENIAFDGLDRRGRIEEDEEDIMGFFGLAGAEGTVNEEGDMTHLVSSRAWLGSMVPPSDFEEDSIVVEPLELHLKHMYALQGTTTRCSVLYTNEGDILYPSSKYVCNYNKKSNSQTLYKGHQQELTCVSVSRDGLIVASVQKSNRPTIHVWDSSTCELLTELPYFHRKGVAAMQFSLDRSMLVSVGQDQDYSIALWLSPSKGWYDGQILATTKGDQNPVLFSSFYDQSKSDGYILGSGGRFHQKFWKVNGNTLNSCYADYDKKHKIGTLLCGNAIGNRFISGATSGHIYVWKGRTLDRIIRAHELGVSCIWTSNKGGVLTASKDGVIKQWSTQIEHMRTFMLSEADVPPILSAIRSMDAFMSYSGEYVNRILVTTSGGEVFEAASKSGVITLLHEAHNLGQLWGLCTHPIDSDVFATTGDDKTIRVWCISSRRLLRKAVIDCTARCINWSPDGTHLIVGMGGLQDGKRQRKDGAFLILDSATLRPLFEGRYVSSPVKLLLAIYCSLYLCDGNLYHFW